MEVKKQKRLYIIIMVGFILFNLLNTYFLTSQLLNRYIAPLSRTLIGEITSIIGNISILVLFIILGEALFKKDRDRFIYFTVISFLLSFFIFALGIFNLFYGTAFSISAFDIFKNPSEGYGFGLTSEIMYEFFYYYRFILFIGTIFLLVTTIIYSKISKKTGISKLYPLTGLKTLTLVLSFFILLGSSSTSYLLQLKYDDFVVGSTSSQKGIQNYGVYPYYVSSFLGIEFESTTRDSLGITDDNLNARYNLFNKNLDSYINPLDGKVYSNDLRVKDSKAIIHDSLNLNNDSSLNGIFEDKNLVLVHLESLNYFLMELESTRSKFTFLNELFKESFVFENFYTSVGLGVSSDAEASVLTGLDVNGYKTLYREYDTYKYEFDTLPKLFSNYDSQAFHGDAKNFYNRDVAYKDMLGFNQRYYSVEVFADVDKSGQSVSEYKSNRFNKGTKYEHYKHDNLVVNSPWPSEYELADAVYEETKNRTNNQFIFSSWIMPHTPFMYNPIPSNDFNDLKIKDITKRYLDFATAIDEGIEAYFIEPKTGNVRPNIEDNVYVFYSDHGSSLKNGDLATLFNKDISLMEERRMLQQTLAFIYAPSNIKTNTLGVNEGLIKGSQYLTRGNNDLYRTIGDLFGVFDSSHFYFGTSGLSNEPSFVIDNRVQDVVIDDVSNIDQKNYVPYFTSLRNPNFRSSKYGESISNYDKILKHIKNYKKHSDLLLVDSLIYQDYKKTLQKQ